MCLVIFAHRSVPDYPLLVAANRDEFHQRPTRASGFWPEHPALLAGRDEQAGGTWMGVTRDGKFAAVTNFRDPGATEVAPRSRGELPTGYLLGQLEPETYLQRLSERAAEYAGFNLLLGDGHSLWYFSNSIPQAGQKYNSPRELQPGIYGLSNAQLDTPWPKVANGKQRLEKMIADDAGVNHEQLLELVSNTDLADPDALHLLGMGTDMEQLLSAQFIRSETYGTRASTTLWFHRQGEISWRELSFDGAGLMLESRQEDFQRS